MENRRFFLIAIFAVLCFFTFQTWKKEHAPVIAQAPASNLPEDAIPTAPAIPAAATEQATPQPTSASSPVPAAAVPAAPLSDARIQVVTDKLRVEISLAGGDLRRVELIGYPVSKNQPNVDLALLDDRAPHFFVLQSGLASAEKPLVSAITMFTAASNHYQLAADADVLEVPLTSTDANGLVTTKLWRFKKGTYRMELVQGVSNTTAQPLQVSAYARFQRTPVAAGNEPPFAKTFMGLGLYEQKEPGEYRFKKTEFKKLDKTPLEMTQTGGWLAMLQHYFVAAILPPQGEVANFVGKPSTVKGYLAQYHGPLQTVAAGATAQFSTVFYIGPKLQGQLDAVAPGLELTEDYGILTPIAKPLFWLLSKFHQYTGNWGVAIILLTLLVKGGMYKLSEKQYRSMARMKKFTPRIAEIREKYAGDRERLNKAMMELYTKEKFNPLAGCWPMLVQFPVFIALYWVLNESVELRQADFALWLNDLSSPDPYYVLPVLFGISMFVQQKFTGQNASMDPMQQRMMQFMPIGMAAFFAFFPAGLVLYWVVSNLIGIAQQWIIAKRVGNEAEAKALKAK